MVNPIEWPKIPDIDMKQLDSCLIERLAMQVKRDGAFVQVSRDWICGRSIDAQTGDYVHYEDVLPYIDIKQIPGDSLLLGEFVVQENGIDNFPKTNSILNRTTVHPTLRGRIVIFDVVMIANYDMRHIEQAERHRLLKSCLFNPEVVNLADAGFEVCEQLKLSQDLYDEITGRGLEGVVLKDTLAPFGQGMWKWKDRKTYVVDITSFEYGEKGSEIEHVAGAFHFTMEISEGKKIEGKVGTGFTRRQREELMQQIPFRAELEALGDPTPKGKLRQPSFKRVVT